MPTRIHIYTHRDLMKEATCIHSYYPYSPQSWEHSPGSTLFPGREEKEIKGIQTRQEEGNHCCLLMARP